LTRREFFKLSIAALTSFSMVPELPVLASENTKRIIPQPPIQETHLTFSETLIPRKITNLLILHHVGGTNREVSASEIHQWHLQNGWAGIGYHYVIHKDGRIEKGRPEAMIGAHCYGYNQTSIGIVSIGNFQTAWPTKQQITSAVHLLAYLCQQYHIQPNASTIVGHRDLNNTDCPGQHYYTSLPTIRQEIRKKLSFT